MLEANMVDGKKIAAAHQNGRYAVFVTMVNGSKHEVRISSVIEDWVRLKKVSDQVSK